MKYSFLHSNNATDANLANGKADDYTLRHGGLRTEMGKH
jgi:hypothetical protein